MFERCFNSEEKRCLNSVSTVLKKLFQPCFNSEKNTKIIYQIYLPKPKYKNSESKLNNTRKYTNLACISK